MNKLTVYTGNCGLQTMQNVSTTLPPQSPGHTKPLIISRGGQNQGTYEVGDTSGDHLVQPFHSKHGQLQPADQALGWLGFEYLPRQKLHSLSE